MSKLKKRAKGVRGIVDVYENRDVLERWFVASPEISSVLWECSSCNDNDDVDDDNNDMMVMNSFITRKYINLSTGLYAMSKI